ncbi:TPA: replication regulatory protein RepA [Klebsiella pneumoniae]|uniref:Protein CopB n=2 Tax=Klebsiella pneumoniae TaxID=573 RepID=A0A486QLY1_KLEPN|nr:MULTISPECIES: replication regulatory protein RepA [Klebsiella]MBG2362292.1 replication regulatory protein RepA [Klebsiella pneumoniae]MCW9200246.1 replication regulatory protein RepA [Klebsiella pneumoniae]RNT45422.1 replication regulatory protein RepA [Klebsiella quasipneumoniae subsp. quasipneumoniae]VGL90670.1 RepA2 [Klebsiella pneumoniae]HBT8494616.1 replication regulatory protein RepA [Klebsiella pneumoniae]
MSQVVNVITSSQKTKRPYRKGNPVSANERQKASLARRSNTHKSIHALIQIPLKEKLAQFAEEEGITQAQMIEKLIKLEAERRGNDV